MKITLRVRRSLVTLLAFAGTVLAAGRLDAQPARDGYSYLSYVGSDVALVSRADDDTSARANMPVLAGDRIDTGSASRAEVVLADGGVVRIDVRSRVRFERLARTHESDDARNLLALDDGALSFEARYATTREGASRIDTDDATIVVADVALLRIDTGRRGTEVYVQSGKAEVLSRAGRIVVRSGEYAWVSGSQEPEVDLAAFPRDRFTRFIDERRDRSRRSSSTRHVSSDYAYDYDVAELDDYGSWVYVSSYDRYCWRPRLGADWRPYTNGHWRWTPAGLTWVSYDPWGWLPHHYGSWFLDASFGWCWSPSWHYSPAWVYWTYTPTYLGWCPVGYYGYYGYYDNYYRSVRLWRGAGANEFLYPHLAGRIDLARIDVRAWSFVSNDRIGARFDVSRDVVRGDRIGFRAGDVGVLATAPLRVERGSSGPASASLQDAVRRVALDGRARGAGVNEGLTSILRREQRLSADAENELRNSVVRAGNDPGYRAVAPEALSAGRRIEAGNTLAGRGETPRASGATVERRGGNVESSGSTLEGRGRDVWREAPTAGRRDGVETGRREREEPSARGGSTITREPRGGERPVPPRADDGWRQSGTGERRTESRGGESTPGSVESRTETRRERRDDGSWRSAPAPRESERSGDARPRPREETSGSSGAPVGERRDAEPRRAPESRVEPERRESAPRSYEVPRSERREAPPSGSYERPRSEPRAEPRSEPRSEPRVESRRSEPPPRVEAPAPRAPAPPPPAPRVETRSDASSDRR